MHLEYDIDELLIAVRAVFEQPTYTGQMEWLDGAAVSSHPTAWRLGTVEPSRASGEWHVVHRTC